MLIWPRRSFNSELLVAKSSVTFYISTLNPDPVTMPFHASLTLPDAVTAFGGVQALWWLAAAITLIVRGGKIANLLEKKDMAVS